MLFPFPARCQSGWNHGRVEAPRAWCESGWNHVRAPEEESAEKDCKGVFHAGVSNRALSAQYIGTRLDRNAPSMIVSSSLSRILWERIGRVSEFM